MLLTLFRFPLSSKTKDPDQSEYSSGGDGDHNIEAEGGERNISDFFVFDDWLVNNSEKKHVDVFGEEARLPILFYMLIKILAQGLLLICSAVGFR